MEILNFFAQNYLYIILGIIIIFILVGIFIANFSFDNYLSGLANFLEIPTNFDGNTNDFAKYLSNTYFNGRVDIEIFSENEIASNGYYSPATQSVAISEKIVENSVAGIATVAHEFGHAKQHFCNPKILIKNSRFTRLVKILGNLNWLILLGGIVLFILGQNLFGGICLGIIIFNFIVAVLLKLSTLKVENDATKQALEMLKETNFFDKTELKKFKNFLNLAKKTYTADFFCALLAWTGLTRHTKFFGKN